MRQNQLYNLCDRKKWEEIRKFLDSDSNNKNKKRQSVCYQGGTSGFTCLHHACDEGAPADIIKSLLDIGGKDLVMTTTYWKSTALHFACWKGASFDVMKILIDVGGKELVVAKDNNGDTALHDLCHYINVHTKAANKIKLMLQVAGTETILTDKNDDGETALDYATAEGTSNKIKALLQPRTIKNEPANSNDDASNLVPADDHDNNTTATEIQDQLLQAANHKKIADLENQIESQKVEHQKMIADLETEIVLLSEQNAKQDKDITDWKDRVDNLTTICSERKLELQKLKDSTSCVSLVNAKRERDDEDDDDQDNSSSHARASKRSRIGSTENEMHVEEDDVEAVIQELLHEKQQHINEKQQHMHEKQQHIHEKQQHIHEKQQHIHEKQKNMKLTIELREVRKKLVSAKAQLDQQTVAS